MRVGLACFASSRRRRLDPSGFDPWHLRASGAARSACSIGIRSGDAWAVFLFTFARESGEAVVLNPLRAPSTPSTLSPYSSDQNATSTTNRMTALSADHMMKLEFYGENP